MKSICIKINSSEIEDALVTALVVLIRGDLVETVWGGEEEGVFCQNEDDILVRCEDTGVVAAALVVAKQCYAALRNDADLFNAMIIALNHGHAWPRYALPILASGASFSLVVARTTRELAENEPLSMARPAYSHTSGTGRTSWECKDGKIFIEISRPSGVVLSATIDTRQHDGDSFTIDVVEVDRYLPRHLFALMVAAEPFGAIPARLGQQAILSQRAEVKRAEEKLAQEQDELEYALATFPQ